MAKSKPLPPLKRLEELFDIDDKGRLLRKKANSSRVSRKLGEEVGFLRTNGYRVIAVDGRKYYAHRIVWALFHKTDPGEMEVDHINGVTSDNRAENLRLCSRAQNALNRATQSNSKTGIKGVYFDSRRKKKPWLAQYKGKTLGQFETTEDALTAIANAVAACGDGAFHRPAIDAQARIK
jgi:hypothetical protein